VSGDRWQCFVSYPTSRVMDYTLVVTVLKNNKKQFCLLTLLTRHDRNSRSDSLWLLALLRVSVCTQETHRLPAAQSVPVLGLIHKSASYCNRFSSWVFTYASRCTCWQKCK